MFRIQAILAASLLLAPVSAASAAQLDPIIDLVATASGDMADITFTVPMRIDGTVLGKIVVAESTTGPMTTDDEWDLATPVWETADPDMLKPGTEITFMTEPHAPGTYWFCARAQDDSGWGKLPTDAPDPVTFGGTVAVPPVAGLSVVAGSATTTTLRLTWNALAGSGVQLRIFYSTSAASEPLTPATDWIAGSPSLVTVSLPAQGTTYYFGARARNVTHEESAMSASPHPSGTTLGIAIEPPVEPPTDDSPDSSCPMSAPGSAAGWLLLAAGTAFLIRR